MNTHEVEAELTRLIERRSPKGGQDPDEREQLYAESVRRYREARRQERPAERDAFKLPTGDLHAQLSREHSAKVEACLAKRGRPLGA
jgi:hypothetical protein